MRKALFILICISISQLYCCKKNTATELIPTGPVNLSLDLNLPQYTKLRFPGELIFLEGGIKGVLLIHDFDDNWYAFERTCAFEPLNACSKLQIDTQGLAIQCGEIKSGRYEKCCDSKYSYSGFPTAGQAKGPLARYNVSRLGNVVSVYN